MPASRLRLLQGLPVLDEARALGDMVVEPTCGGIALVRHPVKPSGAIGARKIRDGLDQQGPGAEAAFAIVDIEILQTASPFRQPAGAMEDRMNDADQPPAVVESTERMHRLGRVVKP